jgi:hypothetical protein
VYINERGDLYRVEEVKDGIVTYRTMNFGEWKYQGEEKIRRFMQDKQKLDRPLEDEMADAVSFLSGYSRNASSEHIDDDDDDDEDDENSTNALATRGDKKTYEAMRDIAQSRRDYMEKVQFLISRKLKAIEGELHHLSSKVAKLQRVIDIIELYMGVHEEITQIRYGDLAPVTEPIHIRQLILYMDEEYGDPRPNKANRMPGLDFSSVDQFDEWVTIEKNMNLVIPELKGIVAIKPSRQKRQYSDNPLVNSFINADNAMTYLLIRNGDNLYRVWTSIAFPKTLFPKIDKEDTFIYHDDNKSEEYQRTTMILQGLFDRSQILRPWPAERIILTQNECYEKGWVVLIRDAEESAILADGRMRYYDWRRTVNEKIDEGSRIVLIGVRRSLENDYSTRFVRYYTPRDWRLPDTPDDGVYQVYRDKTGSKRGDLVIRYNPNDTVYGSWGEWEPHGRKNKLSFYIYKSDAFVLNYDQIDLSDIDYYLSSRLDRRDYLFMIPQLWELRDRLLEEREKEKHFVALVAGRVGCDESTVWAAVDWGKFKNKWKRRVDSDDAKALRMIEGYIKRQKDLAIL